MCFKLVHVHCGTQILRLYVPQSFYMPVKSNELLKQAKTQQLMRLEEEMV